VNFTCRTEGFSTLIYSWFMVKSANGVVSNSGVEVNSSTETYTITNPVYDQNNTGYYCVATNNEGIAVSNMSTLRGTVLIIKTHGSVSCGPRS